MQAPYAYIKRFEALILLYQDVCHTTDFDLFASHTQSWQALAGPRSMVLTAQSAVTQGANNHNKWCHLLPTGCSIKIGRMCGRTKSNPALTEKYSLIFAMMQPSSASLVRHGTTTSSSAGDAATAPSLLLGWFPSATCSIAIIKWVHTLFARHSKSQEVCCKLS